MLRFPLLFTNELSCCVPFDVTLVRESVTVIGKPQLPHFEDWLFLCIKAVTFQYANYTMILRSSILMLCCVELSCRREAHIPNISPLPAPIICWGMGGFAFHVRGRRVTQLG